MKVFFNKADSPVIAFFLKVRQVVGAIDVDGVELKVARSVRAKSRLDLPFETNMLVSQQKQAIAKYAEWIKRNGSRFREGEWYFAGQLIHS